MTISSRVEQGIEGGEWEVIAIFFIGTTIISSAGWLCYWVGSAALVKFITDKEGKPPSDEELKACCIYVIKKKLHIRQDID